MDGVNAVILIGNVGNISEIKETGRSRIVTVSLATSERYSDSDNNKKVDTQWHKIVFWNNLADICDKLVQKGSTIYVEGKLNYKRRDDGSYLTEIVAKTVRVLMKNKINEEQDSY